MNRDLKLSIRTSFFRKCIARWITKGQQTKWRWWRWTFNEKKKCRRMKGKQSEARKGKGVKWLWFQWLFSVAFDFFLCVSIIWLAEGSLPSGYLRRTRKCSCSCSSALMYYLLCCDLCVQRLNECILCNCWKRTVWKVFEAKETFSTNSSWSFCYCYCGRDSVVHMSFPYCLYGHFKTDLQANALKFICKNYIQWIWCLAFSTILK